MPEIRLSQFELEYLEEILKKAGIGLNHVTGPSTEGFYTIFNIPAKPTAESLLKKDTTTYRDIDNVERNFETGEANRTLGFEKVTLDSENVSLEQLGTHWNEHSAKGIWSDECIICIFAQDNAKDSFTNPLRKHPYTCGICDWGRSPENFDYHAFQHHMENVHKLEEIGGQWHYPKKG